MEGEWTVQKISYVNSQGFEYKYTPSGTITFSQIDDFNYGFQISVDYPEDTIPSFFDTGVLTYDSKFKTYICYRNGQENYSSMPLLTKDELLFHFNSSDFLCKIVAEK